MVIEDNDDIQLFLKQSTKTALLDDAGFWKEVENVNNVLLTVSKWVTYFESNSNNISQVVECLFEINMIFIENVKD